MKNVRVKVIECCGNDMYEYGICDGKKILMTNPIKLWERKCYAIRAAKAMSKRIGIIKYDPEIIKQKGC